MSNVNRKTRRGRLNGKKYTGGPPQASRGAKQPGPIEQAIQFRQLAELVVSELEALVHDEIFSEDERVKLRELLIESRDQLRGSRAYLVATARQALAALAGGSPGVSEDVESRLETAGNAGGLVDVDGEPLESDGGGCLTRDEIED